jgi:phage regulator Rha-like protein
MEICKDNLAGLVTVDSDGELRTSSFVLARGLEQSHAAVLKLARRYLTELEEFGRVSFEVQPFATSGGRQNREVAMLNSDQSALLGSMLRNNARTVRFKVSLVKEFKRMRQELERRETNLWQQMHALVAKEVESQVRASFGSHLMLARKKEKPTLETERQMLETAIQPSLLN